MINRDKQSSERDFLKFIAYSQVIGIILVVLGHSFHEYENHGYYLTVYQMIYSFHMPLFLFLSGFLMAYTYRMYGAKKWDRFLLSKTQRLIIPYFILLTVTFIPRCAFNAFADDTIELSIGSFLSSIFYREKLIIPYFWFMASVFTLLTINYIILRIIDRFNFNEDRVLVLTIIIFSFLSFGEDYTSFFSLDRTFGLGLFFNIGMLYAKYHDKIDEILFLGSFPVLLCGVFMWAVSFFLVSDTVFQPICSLWGILMSLSLAKYIETHNITVLDHLIGCNYIIFLLSWYCNIASQQVLHHFVDAPACFFTFVSLLTGIYMPWGIYRYMQQYPNGKLAYFGNILLGQSFKRTEKVRLI